MTRPVIGLTTTFTQAKWSVWDTDAVLIDARYLIAVERAGATAVLLPPSGGRAEDVLPRVDGVIFIGGRDVDPELYGAKPHPRTSPAVRKLDDWHLALVKAAIAHNVPFLAICRGMQLVNIVQGGTLTQHLPDVVGHEGHQPLVGVKTKHEVRVAADSVLDSIMGMRPEVVTYHHQGIEKLGTDLTPIAWTDDGLIEAVQLLNHPWGVGVQWHAEEDDSPLVETLVTIACQHSSRQN